MDGVGVQGHVVDVEANAAHVLVAEGALKERSSSYNLPNNHQNVANGFFKLKNFSPRLSFSLFQNRSVWS